MPSSPILSSSSSSSSSSSPSSSFPSSSSPSSSLSSPTSTTSTSTPARRKSRVSAEHTLTRVRENQRRHRARRRDYIHTLEVQLAETELHLEAARREIDGLRAEREGWRDKDGVEGWGGAVDKQVALEVFALGHALGQEVNVEMRTTDMDMQMEYPSPGSGSTWASASASTSASTSASLSTTASSSPLAPPLDDMPISVPVPMPMPESLPPTGPPPCCADTQETTPTPPIDPALPPSTTPTLLTNPRTRSIPASTPSTGPECSTCATRPLPSPNESTTLCSQAYMLISQQNFRGIDPATIRLWLRQGYRRARRSGEGCTVENGVLMGVLDFISGEL